MNKFLLEIITPERIFFKEEVEMLIVKGTEGDIGILKNHEPFVTQLGIGMVKIRNNEEIKQAVIVQGYLKVTNERVVVLADSAEWPEEIDIDRAQKAKEEAEKMLKKKIKGIELVKAEISLKKAIARIEAYKIINKH